MARRKTDPVMQKLRRLARAGRRREAVEVLEQALRDNPSHAKVREELTRYVTGKPFSFEETDFSELKEILTDFLRQPQRLCSYRKKGLKRLRHRVNYLEQTLGHMLSVTDKKTIQQLRAAIDRERQRRSKPLGRIGTITAICLGVALLVSGGGFYLWKNAEKAADALSSARDNYQKSTAENLLKVHDTGLNRTLNRRVGEEADRLRSLIKASTQRMNEVDSILKRIENGSESVVGQGVRRRAQIERRLQELGPDAIDLQTRWAELCRKEKKELNQQRLSLAEELMLPLPEWEALQGIPRLDKETLEKRQKKLQQRLNIYEDTAEALKLPEDIILPVKQEMETNKKLLSEIRAFVNLLELLPSAHDFDSYRKFLLQFKSDSYQPARDMLAVLQHFPTVTDIQSMMQEHGQNLPAGLLLAARKSLVEGGPSFSRDFPATRRQLHILNELLTNSALATRVYELTNTVEGLHAYSEALPELRYGRACFNRSGLDPERDVSSRKYEEWQNPQAVVSRTLDPRSLYKLLGLDNKSGFATTVNLPLAITKLMQHEHPEVPALAKAYIFYHLLLINESSSHQVLSGLRYAPTMREAVESFEVLRRECNVRLDGNCWLYYSPEYTAAEIRYARWFKKNKKVNFAGELRKNLNSLFNVSPRFCGYIDENAEAVLFEKIKADKSIWYLSNGALITTPYGSRLEKPDRLSPVFIMEKQY